MTHMYSVLAPYMSDKIAVVNLKVTFTYYSRFYFFQFFITEHTQVTPGLLMVQRFCDNIYTIIYYAFIPYIHMLVLH